MPRRPLPSPGSLQVRFPGLIGTMGRSDFLPSFPGGSLTRPPVPSSRCLFRSRRWPALPAPGQGFGLPAPLPAFQVRRQQDLPSSRQTLSMHALLTSDPGGTGAPGHSALAMLPSAPDTASAPTKTAISGLNHTACTFAVYASQRRLPERHARLASGRWPALPGRDSTRRICSEGFQNDSSHVISSPFPELCSAHARADTFDTESSSSPSSELNSPYQVRRSEEVRGFAKS